MAPCLKNSLKITKRQMCRVCYIAKLGLARLMPLRLLLPLLHLSLLLLRWCCTFAAGAVANSGSREPFIVRIDRTLYFSLLRYISQPISVCCCRKPCLRVMSTDTAWTFGTTVELCSIITSVCRSCQFCCATSSSCWFLEESCIRYSF